METDPVVRLRRLLGEQWSPQWRAIEAIERACNEIERLRGMNHPEAASPIADFMARASELDGFVPDAVRQEQRHLNSGSVERDYWHYGYLKALEDVIRRLEQPTPQK